MVEVDKRIIERDEKGRIVKSHLSSDQAREIGALGGQKRIKQAEHDALSLIQELGFESIEDAPPDMVLLAKEAARGKVPAITAFIRFTRGKDNIASTEEITLKTGDVCPTCKRVYKWYTWAQTHYTKGMIAKLLARIAEGKEIESKSADAGRAVHITDGEDVQ